METNHKHDIVAEADNRRGGADLQRKFEPHGT